MKLFKIIICVKNFLQNLNQFFQHVLHYDVLDPILIFFQFLMHLLFKINLHLFIYLFIRFHFKQEFFLHYLELEQLFLIFL